MKEQGSEEAVIKKNSQIYNLGRFLMKMVLSQLGEDWINRI